MSLSGLSTRPLVVSCQLARLIFGTPRAVYMAHRLAKVWPRGIVVCMGKGGLVVPKSVTWLERGLVCHLVTHECDMERKIRGVFSSRFWVYSNKLGRSGLHFFH